MALRADMDALPVTETADLPFASKVKTEYAGQQVGVMHACGHDTHMAMLMGTAKVLVAMKDQLKGKVKFIFQPAEEGPPAGEEGGAELMVKQGVMTDVDAIFALHINSSTPVGKVKYRHGGIFAAVDSMKITIKGKQVHGAYPWNGVDPIVTAAQVIMGLQTIVSRELKLIDDAAVVTIGSIHGGVRSNIIPDKVEMLGTVRSLRPEMRTQLRQAIQKKATLIAKSMNAEAEVIIPYGDAYPVTYNNDQLMDQMLPTLRRTVGEDNLINTVAQTGAEDFSFFQQQAPGLMLLLGGRAKETSPKDAPAHHTPEFVIDESGLKTGVQVLTNLTLDYLTQQQ